ncbi:hypothetical protein TrCOL_g5344 [Triparma columacea]|uniref:Menorin-like domain-containing protein n=1 Tax=Triparma columacea TaxID=722753 RepID=A0A9W7LFR0_9STRA|nr:hypothetical protein TrCOL_g5344 [Triparma columacea]
MAHPPSRSSDLPFSTFVDLCYSSPTPKHIKLDFKEYEVVQPCLATLLKLTGSLPPPVASSPKVYLNADVLPGPGKRDCPPTVNASDFLTLCLAEGPEHALSLGWSCNVARCMNEGGVYTEEDVEGMAGLVEKYDLEAKSGGVVFAANCRIACKDPSTLISLLLRCRSSQILLWTGTGEPSIMQHKVDEVRRAFEEGGVGDRVGFDCKVAEGRVEGWKNEIMVQAINVINWIRGCGI